MATSDAQKRATAKWDAQNTDKITIKLNHAKGKDPGKADIQAAAARDGLSMNAWIIEAIRAKL